MPKKALKQALLKLWSDQLNDYSEIYRETIQLEHLLIHRNMEHLLTNEVKRESIMKCTAIRSHEIERYEREWLNFTPILPEDVLKFKSEAKEILQKIAKELETQKNVLHEQMRYIGTDLEHVDTIRKVKRAYDTKFVEARFVDKTR